jgi:Pyruvate/2-oxoacid:ferredoxin oxidoreductase gamma subunit
MPAVAANLIMLGYAAGRGMLFCGPELLEEVVAGKTPPRFREVNLRAFQAGRAADGKTP